MPDRGQEPKPGVEEAAEAEDDRERLAKPVVSSRLAVESHGSGFYRVIARYGFMDEPSAIEVLSLLRENHVDFPLDDTTFFLGRERLISTTRPGMSPWREAIFAFMSRNALQATFYFRIPPDRVIEVGSQVEI